MNMNNINHKSRKDAMEFLTVSGFPCSYSGKNKQLYVQCEKSPYFKSRLRKTIEDFYNITIEFTYIQKRKR